MMYIYKTYYTILQLLKLNKCQNKNILAASIWQWDKVQTEGIFFMIQKRLLNVKA